MDFKEHNGLIVNEAFIDVLSSSGLDSFASLAGIKEYEVIKDKGHRCVLRFNVGGAGGRTFYLKKHLWPAYERLSYILPWKRKEKGIDEWRSTIMLKEMGFNVAEPVAFGELRSLGVPTMTIMLTESLYNTVKLDEYIPTLTKELPTDLSTAEAMKIKRLLMRRLGTLAARFHSLGLNHQDFYLTHFLLEVGSGLEADSGRIFIADLQRVGKRPVPRMRWVVKDLAQFAYSALTCKGLTRTDLLRFAHSYMGKDRFANEDKKMVHVIMNKVRKIARHTDKMYGRKGRRSG